MKKFSVRTFTLLSGLLLSLHSTMSLAQCGPLSTPTLTNNGQDGIMFDIQAIQSVNITQFAMDFDTGIHTIEIYAKAGTHVGFANTPGAWTLLGSTSGWNSTGGTNVLIPIVLSQFLCAGDVAGFYITSTTGGCNYSNGAAVGNVMVADANIQIKEGTGKDYAFGASFTPRKPNVTVYYSCAISCCLPPTMSFVAETCSGACDGTATATVGAGGIAPYTYLWDAAAGNQTTQTATGLCAGTYNVDVTDNTGCISTNSVTVTSGAASANATITPAGPYCGSDPVVWLTGADPGGAWSGTGITNATTGAFDPGVAGTGIHTITYTIAGACGDSQTTDITVNPNFDATITPAGPYCETDAPVLLSAVDPGGTWSGAGITNATTGAFDPAIAAAGIHTITYTIAGACGDVQTTDITVTAAYDATITPVGPYCENDPAILLTGADPGGTWSGTGITNAATGAFDPGVAGTGLHTITYTIAGACGDSQTTDITVNPNFDATITPAGPYCETDAAVWLSAIDAGGTWSGTGITNAATGEFDPVVAAAGTHTITYTIAGACGDVQTTDITVTAAYDATITPVGPYCENDAAVWLTGADPGGTWSGAGITNAATGAFDPGVAGTGLHTITYTIAGACGDSQTTDITVNPNFDATITPAGPYCETDAALWLSAVDPGGIWSGTGITDATTGTFDPAIAAAGTHTITYTIAGACGDVQMTDIIVNVTFDATITPAGPYCETDASVTLSAVDPGGLWSGTGIIDVVTGEFDPAVAGAGTHTITYTITGTCGDVQTTDIIINSIDDATITPAGPFCFGSPVYTLIGAAGNGNWSGTGITNPSTGEFDASAAGPGIHTITYITGGACPSTSTTDIEVLDVLVIQAFQDATICSGESSNLSATGNGGDGNLTYTWTDQLGNTFGTGTALMVAPLTTTTYTVTLTDGCITPAVSSSVTVTVNPIPVVNFIADVITGCAPLDVTFTDISTPAGTDGLWNFGNGITSGGLGSISTQYNQPGCYDVTLTITANGCTSSETIQDMICVSDYPNAQFNFSPDQPDILNAEIQFNNQSTSATNFSWDFGDTTVSSSDTNPLHLYAPEAQTYNVCLIASNNANCADTVCVNVTIEDLLLYFIPNSFSPDGNLVNQTFKPIFTSGFDPFDFNIKIFDRWGEIIWESNDNVYGWDGVGKNGKLVQSGSYVWQVEFRLLKNDTREIETGHVNVLR